MPKYAVTFAQYWEYEVEADNEDEAFDNAYHEFVSEMLYPVANTNYDEYLVEEVEE